MLDSALWDWVSSCSPNDNTSSDLISFHCNFIKHTISMLSVSRVFFFSFFHSFLFPHKGHITLEDRTYSSSSCACVLSLGSLEQVRLPVTFKESVEVERTE